MLKPAARTYEFVSHFVVVADMLPVSPNQIIIIIIIIKHNLNLNTWTVGLWSARPLGLPAASGEAVEITYNARRGSEIWYIDHSIKWVLFDLANFPRSEC